MKGIKLNSTTIKSFAKSAGKFIEKNAPAILAGLGVAGMIGAVVSAASAGGEVKEALEKAEIKKNEKALEERMATGDDSTPIESLTWKEKGLVYAKYYWKAVLLALVSAAATCGSVYCGNRKIKMYEVLAAAASTNLIDFEEATKKVVGEKKFNEIKNKVLEDDLAKNPPSEEIVHNTGRGNTLMYEPWFRTYFRSDIENVRALAGDIATECATEHEIYMGDIYRKLGIDTDKDIEELIKDMNRGVYHSLIDSHGYFCDPEEGIYHLPQLKLPAPVKSVVLNGKEEPCYVVDFGKPMSIDDLERDSFRRK
jgi:hypothetical protein